MLDFAIKYKSQIESVATSTYLDEKYKYYYQSYHSFEKNFAKDDWNEINFVSIKNEYEPDLIGLLSADLDRAKKKAYNLAIIRYDMSSKYDILFAKDIYNFIKTIFFKYNIEKINFFACTEATYNINMYDKFIKKYNGRIVGILKKDFLLCDGTICDVKLYEIFKEDCMKAKNRSIKSKKQKNKKTKSKKGKEKA